jgi:hypothetical protein
LVYTLLPNKKSEPNENFFKFIKYIIILHEKEQIIIDFEKAIENVFTSCKVLIYFFSFLPMFI